MIYKSCDLIEHGIDFAQDGITFCCRKTFENGCFHYFIKDYYGEELNIKDFFELKRNFREKMKSGEGISECRNCEYLQEKDYDEQDYISIINFNQGNNCNLNCIYCSRTHGETCSRKEYSVYPLIKSLADGGCLQSGGYVTFASGEPTLSPDFEKVLMILINEGLSSIRVLTNGTIYSEAIAYGLRMKSVNVEISVDSGSSEMFRWIKGTDLYYEVWNNIEKYLKVQYSPELVKIKYIIIPEINDDKDQIIRFLDEAVFRKATSIVFDIEMNWFEENKDNISQNIYDLITFTKEETLKRNLKYEAVERASFILQYFNKKSSKISHN